MKDEADKHRAVVAAADDLQAVVAELNAGHGARVPPQRALLFMDQPPHVSISARSSQIIRQVKTRYAPPCPLPHSRP